MTLETKKNQVIEKLKRVDNELLLNRIEALIDEYAFHAKNQDAIRSSEKPNRFRSIVEMKKKPQGPLSFKDDIEDLMRTMDLN